MTPSVPAPAGEARLQEIRARWTDDPRRFFDATRHAHCDADIAFLLELVGASGAPGRDATPAGPWEFCHDCGARMMWSDPDASTPSWMCPRCVYYRMVRAEESLAGASRGLPAPPGKQHWQWAWDRAAVLENAIRWALGEEGDFAPRPDGAGAYWWRSELRERAFGGLPAAPSDTLVTDEEAEAVREIVRRQDALNDPYAWHRGIEWLLRERGVRPDNDGSAWDCVECGTNVTGPSVAPVCPKGCGRMARARTALGEGRPE